MASETRGAAGTRSGRKGAMSEAIVRTHPWLLGLLAGLLHGVVWTVLMALEHPRSLQGAVLVGAITSVVAFAAATAYTVHALRSPEFPRPQPWWFITTLILLPMFVANGAEFVVIEGHSILDAIVVTVLAALVTAALIALCLSVGVPLFRRYLRSRGDE